MCVPPFWFYGADAGVRPLYVAAFVPAFHVRIIKKPPEAVSFLLTALASLQYSTGQSPLISPFIPPCPFLSPLPRSFPHFTHILCIKKAGRWGFLRPAFHHIFGSHCFVFRLYVAFLLQRNALRSITSGHSRQWTFPSSSCLLYLWQISFSLSVILLLLCFSCPLRLLVVVEQVGRLASGGLLC